MKISVINENGTTVYSDSIDRTGDVVEDDFAQVLSQQTANLYSSSSTYGTTNADGSKTMTLQEIFQEASDTYGVDINLLKAVAQEESYFQADATSSCGAMGIMQLMPSTAESLGVTDGYDAYQNVMGGAKLLSQLLDKYDGDTTLALAAYSAGSGAVAKYGGVPPYTETQNMIKKVNKMMSEGVTIPDATYTVSTSGTSQAVDTETSSKAAAAKELSTLLADFSNHDSYSEFIQGMNEITNLADLDTDSSDAYVAYEKLLNNANTVIKNMIAERS